MIKRLLDAILVGDRDSVAVRKHLDLPPEGCPIQAIRIMEAELEETRRQNVLMRATLKSIAGGCGTFGRMTRTMERHDMMTLAMQTVRETE